MIIKKQKDEKGEFVVLPENHNIKQYGEWIEIPEGLFLKNVNLVSVKTEIPERVDKELKKLCKKLKISQNEFVSVAIFNGIQEIYKYRGMFSRSKIIAMCIINEIERQKEKQIKSKNQNVTIHFRIGNKIFATEGNATFVREIDNPEDDLLISLRVEK